MRIWLKNNEIIEKVVWNYFYFLSYFLDSTINSGHFQCFICHHETSFFQELRHYEKQQVMLMLTYTCKSWKLATVSRNPQLLMALASSAHSANKVIWIFLKKVTFFFFFYCLVFLHYHLVSNLFLIKAISEEFTLSLTEGVHLLHFF